jgi:hypothetical protein
LPLCVYTHNMPLCDIHQVKDIIFIFEVNQGKCFLYYVFGCLECFLLKWELDSCHLHKNYRFHLLMDSLLKAIYIMSWYLQFKHSCYYSTLNYAHFLLGMHSIQQRYSEIEGITFECFPKSCFCHETCICHYVCIHMICHYVISIS